MLPDCDSIFWKCDSPSQQRLIWYVFLHFLECYATVILILEPVWLFPKQAHYRASDMTVNMLIQRRISRSLWGSGVVLIHNHDFFSFIRYVVQYAVGAKIYNHCAMARVVYILCYTTTVFLVCCILLVYSLAYLARLRRLISNHKRSQIFNKFICWHLRIGFCPVSM